MNPLCPNCQTELTDDFGLVDCQSCGAVCSVDLEDNVTVQSDDPLGDATMGQSDSEGVDAYTYDGEEDEDAADDETEDSFEEDLFDEDEESEENDSIDAEALLNEIEDTLEVESIDHKTPEAKRSKLDAPVATASLSGEDFLKDLEIFSEEATADGGHIYYDFHVTGIEGGQRREEFIETLADARLEISEDAVREILGKSSDFTLMQISFLRLTVIYRRLLILGLDMSWTLSELQEPVSYLSEEIEEVDLYEDEDIGLYKESEDDDY